jgi:hypothetical protein
MKGRAPSISSPPRKSESRHPVLQRALLDPKLSTSAKNFNLAFQSIWIKPRASKHVCYAILLKPISLSSLPYHRPTQSSSQNLLGFLWIPACKIWHWWLIILHSLRKQGTYWISIHAFTIKTVREAFIFIWKEHNLQGSCDRGFDIEILQISLIILL